MRSRVSSSRSRAGRAGQAVVSCVAVMDASSCRRAHPSRHGPICPRDLGPDQPAPSVAGAASSVGAAVGGTYPGGVRDWLRAATTPRMLGIFALLLVGAVVCVRLGAWQIDRAVGAAERQAAIAQAARGQAPPVPMADVGAPQTSFTQATGGTREIG